jgi:hypothetical protein
MTDEATLRAESWLDAVNMARHIARRYLSKSSLWERGFKTDGKPVEPDPEMADRYQQRARGATWVADHLQQTRRTGGPPCRSVSHPTSRREMRAMGCIQYIAKFYGLPEDDRDEESVFIAEHAPRRYGRSKRAWRTPRLHIIAGERVIIDDATIYTVWCCGYSTEYVQITDIVPDGVEICQPCASALAFWRQRADEQAEIDRAAYNMETRRLLEAADR